MKKLQFGVLFILLSLPLVYSIPLLEVVKLKTFDALVPEQSPSDYFTILNITEEDIAMRLAILYHVRPLHKYI